MGADGESEIVVVGFVCFGAAFCFSEVQGGEEEDAVEEGFVFKCKVWEDGRIDVSD